MDEYPDVVPVPGYLLHPAPKKRCETCVYRRFTPHTARSSFYSCGFHQPEPEPRFDPATKQVRPEWERWYWEVANIDSTLGCCDQHTQRQA